MKKNSTQKRVFTR
jgi:hypothetical protein